MREFAWAENNLGVDEPQKLQEDGVDVFFAPNITETRVIDLSDGRVEYFDGRVEYFKEGIPAPREGLYADYGSLEGYCREKGIPLVETKGRISVLPMHSGEAGDPLRREGR